jgi:ribA/ribD-fused uncharacterized protein
MTPPTLEHHYQAAKCQNQRYASRILKASSPAEAKKMGKTAIVREDWNKIKLGVMEELLRTKFRDERLKEKLLATGNEEIVEENWWGDRYWGICNGEGENNLGKLLMKIRNEVKEYEKRKCINSCIHATDINKQGRMFTCKGHGYTSIREIEATNHKCKDFKKKETT